MDDTRTALLAELESLAKAKRFKGLLKKAEVCVAEHEDWYAGYWFRGWANLNARDLDAALIDSAQADLTTAKRLHPALDTQVELPDAIIDGAKGDVFAWIELLTARRHARSNKFKACVTCASKAVEIDPDCTEARFWLGRYTREAGDYARSEAAFTQLIERQPDVAGHYYERILARQNLGDDAGVIADWRRRIELQPGRAGHHIGLAAALRSAGDLDGARAELERALEIDPESNKARAAIDALAS